MKYDSFVSKIKDITNCDFAVKYYYALPCFFESESAKMLFEKMNIDEAMKKLCPLILSEMAKTGWIIVFADEIFDEDESYYGMCDEKEKMIVISCAIPMEIEGSLYHEVAHYMDLFFKRTNKAERKNFSANKNLVIAMESEKSNFFEILLDGITKGKVLTTKEKELTIVKLKKKFGMADEYFAESVSLYLKGSDAFKSKCPKTYQIVKEIFEDTNVIMNILKKKNA